MHPKCLPAQMHSKSKVQIFDSNRNSRHPLIGWLPTRQKTGATDPRLTIRKTTADNELDLKYSTFLLLTLCFFIITKSCCSTFMSNYLYNTRREPNNRYDYPICRSAAWLKLCPVLQYPCWPMFQVVCHSVRVCRQCWQTLPGAYF